MSYTLKIDGETWTLAKDQDPKTVYELLQRACKGAGPETILVEGRAGETRDLLINGAQIKTAQIFEKRTGVASW